MDIKWNSTDKERQAHKDLAEDFQKMMGAGKPAPAAVKELSPAEKRYWRRRKAQGAAALLAFFLGVSLILSSLGTAAAGLAWERWMEPPVVGRWQNTQAFRDEVSSLLREFLTIGAGGRVDFGGFWDGGYDSAVIVEQETIRSWWGFGETVFYKSPFKKQLFQVENPVHPQAPEHQKTLCPDSHRHPHQTFSKIRNNTSLFCAEIERKNKDRSLIIRKEHACLQSAYVRIRRYLWNG